jgi:hypothetical protein
MSSGSALRKRLEAAAAAWLAVAQGGGGENADPQARREASPASQARGRATTAGFLCLRCMPRHATVLTVQSYSSHFFFNQAPDHFLMPCIHSSK